jgi:hypothetical protein
MPPRPSIARTFCDLIASAADPAAEIRKLTHPERALSEEEWLDCKADPLSDTRKSNVPAKSREENLRSIWCKALSGFGNSGDGVLVWGLDARKGEEGVDIIRAPVLVNNPSALRSRLMELQHQATEPVLGGVEVKACEDQPGSGKGYVVCFVPEGAFKPYRAEIPGKKQYYIRAGDQFVMASQEQLRALFYPRAQAHLEVTAVVQWRLSERGDEAIFECGLAAKNVGSASARSLEITVASAHRLKKLANVATPNRRWEPECLGGGLWQYTFQRTLHPGGTAPEFRLEWSTPTTSAISESGNRGIPLSPDIDLRLSIYAENQPPQYARFQFPMDELTLLLGVGHATRTRVAEETQPW